VDAVKDAESLCKGGLPGAGKNKQTFGTRPGQRCGSQRENRGWPGITRNRKRKIHGGGLYKRQKTPGTRPKKSRAREKRGPGKAFGSGWGAKRSEKKNQTTQRGEKKKNEGRLNGPVTGG